MEDIWQYLEIINGKRNLFFWEKSNNNQEKINALDNILKLGLPSSISYLIPILKNDDAEIRTHAYDVIIHLFEKVSSKDGFYEAVRYCEISKSDLDYFKVTFQNTEYIKLLTIVSFNKDGHIREKAIKKLGESQNLLAIPFVIYRLADWVSQVRMEATKVFDMFLKEIFLNTLIENLPTILWLQKVNRVDLNHIYSKTIDFLMNQNRDAVLQNFSSYTDQVKGIIARELVGSNDISHDEIDLLLSDKNYIIRNCVIKRFELLSNNQIRQLLHDKSSKNRYDTLVQLRGTPFFGELLLSYLADNAHSVRSFARYYSHLKSENYGELYSANLKSNINIIGSIAGIAEIDGKAFADSIKPFLTSHSPKITKIAFIALSKLEENYAYEFAIQHLNTAYHNLRKSIITFLAKRPTKEVLENARTIFKNGDYELKKSMLSLFFLIGGYKAIPGLMIGTLDNNENIRNLSRQYVEVWKVKAINFFIQPKRQDLEYARNVFDSSYAMHENLKYFVSNPLEEMDFFLK